MRQLEPPGKAWLGTVTGQGAGPGQHQPRDGHEVAPGGARAQRHWLLLVWQKTKKQKNPNPRNKTCSRKQSKHQELERENLRPVRHHVTARAAAPSWVQPEGGCPEPPSASLASKVTARSAQGRRDQPGEAPALCGARRRHRGRRRGPRRGRLGGWKGPCTLWGLRGHWVHPGPPEAAVGRGRGPWSGHTWPWSRARPAAATRRPLPSPHRLLGGWGTGGSLWILQLVGTGSRKLPTKAEVCANSPPRTEAPRPA